MTEKNKLIRETTTTAVYKRLNGLIIEGHFVPGQWLRERELKELLGVSSTPIREAIRMLVQERLLEAIPHQGVRVRKHSVQEIEDFFELRAELEGLAASLAAERGSEAQFKELKEIVNNVEIGLAEKSIDKADAIAYNNRFHDVIAYASGNKALMNSLLQLRAGVNLLRTMAWLNDEQRTSVVNQQHKLICEAITNRNRQLARDQAKAHVWDALPLVLRSTQEFEKNEPDALK